MEVSKMLRGESLMRLLQGVATGAVASMFIGFTLGGWTNNASAWKMAQRDAREATIAALAPICVDKFKNQADAEKNFGTLKKISSWQQATYIEQGGWATMPGATSADMGVAQACAEILGNLKVTGKY